MQAQARKKSSHLKVFKVGIIGASSQEFDIFSRIFTVTKYRTRCYSPVALEVNAMSDFDSVDILLMCSGNPGVINTWSRRLAGIVDAKPMIFLCRTSGMQLGYYQLKSPVNPGKLIKLLDHYTIKELNYFPEFEIGHDSTQVNDSTIKGLRLLHSSKEKEQLLPLAVKKRVLVADDSYAVRKQLEIEFKLLNAELDVVDSAEEAMKAIDKNTYDIIFLDVVMSGMSGYTACKQIKRSKTNKGTPVILLTSRSSSFDRIKGTLVGCDAYLVKPVNHNEFESVYKKFVANA